MLDSIRPLDRCLNPVKVFKPDGVHFYPCGHCLSCRKSYHTRWRERLTHEIQSPNTYTLFVTLTYSNEHLPLVKINPDTNEIISVSRTKFSRGVNSTFHRVKCTDYFRERYGSRWYFLPEHDFTSDFPHYVTSRSSNNIVYDSSYSFGICLRKDVQDFVKRLRSILSRHPATRYKDCSFTYFICSEYGPNTFRPHYHGLLFFRDKRVAQLCNGSLIFNAWRKSDSCSNSENEPISKFVSFGQGAAAYVSKYVTCDSVLPSVIDNPLFRPFHLQSHSRPIGSDAFPLDFAVDKVIKGDILHHREFYSKKFGKYVSVDIPYPSSVWSRVFPKFLFERSLSSSEILRIFKRISELPCSRNGESVIPNLTERFNERFGVGQFVHSRGRQLHIATSLYWFAPFQTHAISWRPYFCGFPTDDSFRAITYSDVFPELCKDKDFLDLYLFGISQNRSACQKIFDCMHNVGSLGDYRFYAYLFLRFRTLEFSISLKSQYEYQNNLLSLNDYDYTPSMVLEVYPELRYRLYPCIDDYDCDTACCFDIYLNSRFNLSLSDFYDEKGNLSVSGTFCPAIHSNYYSQLYYYFNEKNSKARFHYNKNEDF